MKNDLTIQVLLVDDDPNVIGSYSAMLRSANITNIAGLTDSREVMQFLNEHEVNSVILDLMMENISGKELLEMISRDFHHIPVMIITAMNDLQMAVECMKIGAFDYLVKPIDKNQLVSHVEKALEMCSLKLELSSLKHHLFTDELKNIEAFSTIVTVSKKMRAVFQYIEVIAPTDRPVLIMGDTGTGKELIAKSVHDVSGRKGEYVEVNIAGLDDAIFSDTLFGHKKGAFTGAEKDREGLVSRAFGGTLFLDEIGDLSEASQIKLLRLLQSNTYYTLGSDIPRHSDARIIVATNKDLGELINSERFRSDLYYRLRSHQINIPPLKDRKEDITLLTNYFIETAALSLNKKKPSIPDELLILLSSYHFPGNVRELQSMVFDAVARQTNGVISLESFHQIISTERRTPLESSKKYLPENVDLFQLFGKFPTIKELVNHLIDEALKTAQGNQGIAASLLGITRQALNKRLNRMDE
ncbi:MAG: sigma-54-dependent Fis family transcriptional regulator [Nitrospirae bacterium]|nr:sigma-54-dependent Fis family transcriptional regulator [Nitrospirota bacterium]